MLSTKLIKYKFVGAFSTFALASFRNYQLPVVAARGSLARSYTPLLDVVVSVVIFRRLCINQEGWKRASVGLQCAESNVKTVPIS